MKKYLFLLLLSVTLINCKDEVNQPETIDVTKANGIPLSKLSIHFREDFNDDRNGWNLFPKSVNYDFYTEVTGGFYTAYKPTFSLLPTVTTSATKFDQTKNWEIEVKVISESKEFGIWWNSANTDVTRQSYRIGFSGNKIDIMDANQGMNITYIVRDKAIELKQESIVKIRKITDKNYIFVNENLVYEGPMIASKGDSMGFYINGSGKTQVDYVYISYIK